MALDTPRAMAPPIQVRHLLHKLHVQVKTGRQRKLGNLAGDVEAAEMAGFNNAWHLIREAGAATA